ncbi:MAG: hypothetical protein WC227_01980 [Patescibacteria group bacterium]|jgi:hypothetical protein
MRKDYFVRDPFGPEGEKKHLSDRERYDEIWKVSMKALEHHASLHIGDVTGVIILTIQGANLRTVRKRAKFLESLGPGRQFAVKRYITQMVSAHYYPLFAN